MATKKAKNVDMTVVQIIPLDILSSFLCLCIISFSAIFIILSAAPGTTWSYLAKSSGGGNGPEKVCCSLIIAVLTFLLGCGLFVFFISIPYVVSYITPIGIDSVRITDALLFLCIFFYRVGSQREERQESLPE